MSAFDPKRTFPAATSMPIRSSVNTERADADKLGTHDFDCSDQADLKRLAKQVKRTSATVLEISSPNCRGFEVGLLARRARA
jgi:hypothetical protein